MSDFISIETTHSAEIAWWWTEEKLHDRNYHIKVQDAVDLKVREVCANNGVWNDMRYCCQWEGVQLLSENRVAVELAAKEVAVVLSRFKDVVSLAVAATEQPKPTRPRMRA